MKAYYYLYYRYLSFAKTYLKTNYIGESVYFFSMTLLTIYESIVIILFFDVKDGQLAVPLLLVILTFNYFILIRNGKGCKIEAAFSNERKYLKVIGDIMVLLLFILIFFI